MPFPTRKQPNGLPVECPPVAPQGGLEHGPWKSWRPVNFSGVVADLAKWAKMPTSLQETDGYREDLDMNGRQPSRMFTCDWSQADDALTWLHGYSYVIPDPNDSAKFKLRREIPAQDPYMPWLYVDHCSIERGDGAYIVDPGALMTDGAGNPIDFAGNKVPPGDPKQGIWPGMIYAAREAPLGENVGTPFLDGSCHIRARYRERPYPVHNDAFADGQAIGERCRCLQVEREYAIQSLVLAKVATMNTAQGNNLALAFYEGPTGAQVPEGGVILMPTQVYRATWHDVPFVIDPNLKGNVGFVNANDFLLAPGMDVWKAGTVLCEAPQQNGPTRNVAGAVSYKYQFRFAWREKGWNKFPASALVNGARIFDFWGASFGGNANDPKVYLPADFNTLFTPRAMPSW